MRRRAAWLLRECSSISDSMRSSRDRLSLTVAMRLCKNNAGVLSNGMMSPPDLSQIGIGALDRFTNRHTPARLRDCAVHARPLGQVRTCFPDIGAGCESRPRL